MKKLIALLLFLCLNLCACGENPKPPAAPTAPVTNGSEKLKEPVSVESLAGTYKSRLWFLDHTVTFNADGTYSFGDDESGTYSLADKYLTLSTETASSGLIVGNNCIYSFTSWHFDADVDSGVTFSPDHQGLTDQAFEGHIPDGNLPGCDYNYIFLDLQSDGTFTLQVGTKTAATVTVAESFVGTYFCRNATLMLTYNGEDYPLIMNNANYIFFFIYDKVA